MLSITVPKNGLSSTRLPSERPLSRQLVVTRPTGTQAYTPRADVVESKDEIVVRLEVPGMSIEDIDVTLEKNNLTVKAERKAPDSDDGRMFHRSELAYGVYSRSFSLPASVERDHIDASYVNGILTVTLPKAEDQKPKLIEVKVS